MGQRNGEEARKVNCVQFPKAAEAKVENGTLTVTDMLREITAENLARQTKALHEVQLLMNIWNLKYTLNN